MRLAVQPQEVESCSIQGSAASKSKNGASIDPLLPIAPIV